MIFHYLKPVTAVGNAHKEVKERAEYVLDTNLNAGVVKFLEEEMMS